MTPAPRRKVFQYLSVVALVLAALVFRRIFFTFERVLLGVRYFWWLLLILAVGGWLLAKIGRGRE